MFRPIWLQSIGDQVLLLRMEAIRSPGEKFVAAGRELFNIFEKKFSVGAPKSERQAAHLV